MQTIDTLKIKRLTSVEWRKLKWLQPKHFKSMSSEDLEKAINSISNNGFINPLIVWNGYILDGHHRQAVLNEIEKRGHCVPDLIPAVEIACKNIEEARKLVLLYASQYAKVTGDGLYEFLHTGNIDLSEIETECDIPGINFETFKREYFDMEDLEEEEKSGVKRNKCPACGHEW